MPERKKSRDKPASPQRPKARNSPSSNRAKAGPNPRPDDRNAEGFFPGPRLALFVLIAITLIAYANAWPNSLTFDDRIFADSDRFVGIGLAEMTRFFTEDLWSGSGVNSELYRPLLLVLIALESWVFGDWFAGYHLVNIFLHVLATVLVYGLVRHLLLGLGSRPEPAASSALLGGIIFGVHPIHTEVVNSIFNGSEILVCIGVVGGLWWFLQTLPERPGKAWLGLSLVYLLVLFCRESGAALPALAVAILWLCSSEPWLPRVRKCLPVLVLLIPLGIYLAMRVHALEPPAAVEVTSAAAPAEPISTPAEAVSNTIEPGIEELPGQEEQQTVSIDSAEPLIPEKLQSTATSAMRLVLLQPTRLLPAVKLWYESWKIMLWPHPLQIYYDKPDTNVWLALVTQLALLVAGLLAFIRKRPEVLVGTAFFYLAILPSSRVFGGVNLSPGLADRVLYLPSVGLTILIAFGLVVLLRHLNLRYAVASVALVTMVLVPLTWARNAEWINDVTLYERDYSKLGWKKPILDTLIAAHLRENNVNRAVEICDTHVDLVQSVHSVSIHCGTAYGRAGRYADAEQAYLFATEKIRLDIERSKSFAHLNLAMLYLHLGRRGDAQKQFELGIAVQDQSFMREYFSALMLLQFYPNDRTKLIEARAHLEKALELQPQHQDSRRELESLNVRLTPRKKNRQ